MSDQRQADVINQQGVLPDSLGSLWGSNTPQRPTTFARQIARPKAPDPRQPVPQVLSTLKPTEGSRVVANAPAEPRRITFEGNPSAIRAMRLAHQYRTGFWDPGAASAVVASTAADPSAAQLEQAYNDFVLFSYLPPQLMPTKATFIDMSSPSSQATLVQAALPRMGVNVTGTPVLPQTREGNGETENLPILASPPPYSETLGSLCAQQFFLNKINVRP